MQFHNHLKSDVDLLISQPGQSSPTKTLAVLSPDEVYHVPVDFVDNHDFYVRPANFGSAMFDASTALPRFDNTLHVVKKGQTISLKYFMVLSIIASKPKVLFSCGSRNQPQTM